MRYQNLEMGNLDSWYTYKLTYDPRCFMVVVWHRVTWRGSETCRRRITHGIDPRCNLTSTKIVLVDVVAVFIGCFEKLQELMTRKGKVSGRRREQGRVRDSDGFRTQDGFSVGDDDILVHHISHKCWNREEIWRKTERKKDSVCVCVWMMRRKWRRRRGIYKEKCEEKEERKIIKYETKEIAKTSSIIGGSLCTFLATLCPSLFLIFSF